MSDNEEEIEYEEVPAPFVVETGDSVKVKQVLDDAVVEAVSQHGFTPNYTSENQKLLLMTLACASALVAQFYPMPFPDSRALLAVCCAVYYIISTILQLIIAFIDKDMILTTYAREVSMLVKRFM